MLEAFSMIRTSLDIDVVPVLTFISTTSVDPFVKYKKGIPIPEVELKLWVPSFQFIVTVQSEWSDTVVLLEFNPERPTSIGDESPMTPQGIWVTIRPSFLVFKVMG